MKSAGLMGIAAAVVAVLVTQPCLAQAPSGLAQAPSGLAQAPSGRVLVSITSVKASPPGEGASAGVGAGLEKFEAKLKRLPFARYDAAGTTEREVAFGEAVTVSFGGSGRFVLTPRAAKDGGIEVGVEEFPPGKTATCLATASRVEPGKTSITFCDGVPDKAATMVFLSSVSPVAP